LASGYSGTCTIGWCRQESGLHFREFASVDIVVSKTSLWARAQARESRIHSRHQ
jgi:hypothetical protein